MIDRDKSIRERAHQIWEAEGRPEGREADHWEQARTELQKLEDESRPTAATVGGKAKRSGGKTAARPAEDDAGTGAAKPRSPSRGKNQSAPAEDVSPLDRDAAVLGEKPASSRKRNPS
ncbi:hypothetical protein DFR52_101248 [Hoeflea marina]|uniref:DUF2934 family protein n=1 Tax=Hoeflea marina TaxID=274592 RepID=A0A317PRJ8_9HYPH|nr:DUF2934 domain-containing protein [Hoeflea marina]PWW03567.1 hypothetical protein DFR52_101248 [Hoeflea marina]